MTPRRRLMRPIAGLLALLVLAAGLPVRAEDAAASAEQRRVEQIVHDYILQHPEVLMQALEAAEAKEKAERNVSLLADKHGPLYSDPTSPVGGNPAGDVTIVEFFDYRCPYCKAVEPALEALLREDGHIRIIYKEFPILGPASVYAAEAALAARKQGRYDTFHRAMMASRGTIDEAAVLRVAAAAGLDLQQLKADMAAPDVAAVIKADYALAQALDINGTPAFVIGNELISGALDPAGLRAKVAAARNG